jgi:iron complex transport system ATP-binding protein
MIELKHVSYHIQSSAILKDISLSFATHKFNVVLGPNGAGKTTLLKIAAGALDPSSGEVKLENEKIKSYSGKALARRRAVLSQQYEIAFPLSVYEVVMMGRYPHFADKASAQDKDIIHQALHTVGMTHKSKQNYQTLSGGEKQKIQMARVLAQIWNKADDQDHKYLFLDEPTTNLDIRYQLQLLELAQSLLNHNTTVIAILHDLNLSFQYGDNFFFLHEGHLASHTDQKHTISKELIEKIYDVKVEKWTSPSLNEYWQFQIH